MSRDDLARKQVEFVEALASDGCSFDGVPDERMLALRDGLVNRRAKQARRLAPLLDAWLGPRFAPLFRAWVGEDLQPGAPLSELLSFAAGLRGFPDPVAVELAILRVQARGAAWAWLPTRRSVWIGLGRLRFEIRVARSKPGLS